MDRWMDVGQRSLRARQIVNWSSQVQKRERRPTRFALVTDQTGKQLRSDSLFIYFSVSHMLLNGLTMVMPSSSEPFRISFALRLCVLRVQGGKREKISQTRFDRLLSSTQFRTVRQEQYKEIPCISFFFGFIFYRFSTVRRHLNLITKVESLFLFQSQEREDRESNKLLVQQQPANVKRFSPLTQ